MKYLSYCLLVLALTIIPATAGVTHGQHLIQLGEDLATVDVPDEFVFIPEKEAKELMEKEGYSAYGTLGIIASRASSPSDAFYIDCCFVESGYVNDDDSQNLDADAVLSEYKQGTTWQNEKRKKLNLPPIYISGWAEKPHYDKATHHVVWAMEVKEKDSDSAPVTAVNYNTRILGRHGVLSMNLITLPEHLDRDKLQLVRLLNTTKFNKGNSYSDYIPGVDKKAGYGIAGLILGGGAVGLAAKTGLLGLLWKWGLGLVLLLKNIVVAICAALFKFIWIAVVGVFAAIANAVRAIGNLFRRSPKPHHSNGFEEREDSEVQLSEVGRK